MSVYLGHVMRRVFQRTPRLSPDHLPPHHLPHRGPLGLALVGATITLALATPSDAEASDSRFQVKVLASPGPVGRQQTVKVQLTAQDPWHMNTEFPTSLKLGSSPNLDLGKTKFRKQDASTLKEHKIVFSVPVTPKSAGTFSVDGKLKFAICKKEACSPASAKVTLRVQGQAKAAPKPAPPTTKKPARKATKKRTPKSKAPAQKPPAAKAAAITLPPGLGYRMGALMLDPVLGPGAMARVAALWTH